MTDIRFRDADRIIRYRKSKYSGVENDGYVAVFALEGQNYLGQYTVNDVEEAIEIEIPLKSTCVQFSCLSSYTKFYIDFNTDASITSNLYFTDQSIIPIIQLGNVTKLSVYVLNGSIGAVFFK